MFFKVISAKLTGNPDETGWSQAYEFKPDDSQKLNSRGRLFAIISTSTRDVGVDSLLSGREVLLRLHEEYFGNLAESAYERLKKAIKKVINEFSSWEDIGVSAIAFLEDVAYITAGGGAEVWIFRDGVLSKVVESPKSGITSASGYPKDGDVFIVGTKLFFDSIPRGILKGALEGKEPKAAVEALATYVHSQDSNGKLGAIFLKIEKEDESIYALSEPETRETGEPVKIPTQFVQKKEGIVKSFFEKINRPNVYVRQEPRDEESLQKRKVSVSVGVVLLLVLIVSIFFGIKQKKDIDEKARYQERLVSAQHAVQEAEELSELNRQRARELLVEARGKVLGLTSEGIKDPALVELSKKISVNEKRILGEYKVKPEPFVDLSLVASEFSGESITSSQGVVFVLDRDGKKIVRVVVASGRAEIVAGPAIINEVESIASYVDTLYFINSEGVFEADEGKKVIEAEWAGEVLPYSYAGNLYVLEKQANTIWRYAATQDGFSTKRNWFSEGVVVNLTNAKSWVIDGSIWVLTNESILKFSLGNPQPFRLSGIFPEIKNLSAIYTGEDLENLYILDLENSRVVVVSKEGEYKVQYLSDELRNAKSLAVSEKDKKIILLTGDKLLAIEIEHL